jgi:hypothetical protein
LRAISAAFGGRDAQQGSVMSDPVRWRDRIPHRLDAGSRKRVLRVLTFGVGGMALLWQIVATSFVAHLAVVAPETALSLAPADPLALLELADRKLNADSASWSLRRAGEQTIVERPESAIESLSATERDAIRALAEAALRQAPLDARAMRILGQSASDDSAERFMEAAVRRSLNESRAIFWLLQDRFEKRRHADAVQIADILLRTRPNLVEVVTPSLARMAEDEEAFVEVGRLMASAPPWREAFLAYVCDHVSDARTPLRLMLAFEKTRSPPTAESLRTYLAFLFRHRFYDFAYRAWRRFAPPERLQAAGNLYNADFEFPPTGLFFDWTIVNGSGATIEIVPRPGDENRRALVIEYDRERAAPHGVSQHVKLPAGAYRMTGLQRGELIGRRGPRWRIVCAGANAEIGESEMAMGRMSDWRRFQFDFVVPDKDCVVQQARLDLDARSPSEWMVSGKIWYADLKIEPAEVEASALRSSR